MKHARYRISCFKITGKVFYDLWEWSWLGGWIPVMQRDEPMELKTEMDRRVEAHRKVRATVTHYYDDNGKEMFT